jgi:hypothetical protein
MATRQKLLTGALKALGERRFDTGDGAKPVRAFNDVYDEVLEECLQEGSWNFAMETIKADADTGVDPNFGYTEVFAKPSDWVRTHAVSQDEYFAYPLLHYYDDERYWSADSTPIYVRYVSNDTGLGNELSRWPASYRRYVELELALRIAPEITQSSTIIQQVEKQRDKARTNARNKDAMDEANPKFAPPGTWTRSRTSRTGGDRGSRNSLTG